MRRLYSAVLAMSFELYKESESRTEVFYQMPDNQTDRKRGRGMPLTGESKTASWLVSSFDGGYAGIDTDDE